jgi:DNA-binding CsgD family transcriptional regulator
LANCKTCGRELHPERAEKYDYCTDPECQKRNARGLTIIAHGVNKAADQYQILDDQISDEVASGQWIEEKVSGKDLARRRPSRKDRGAKSRGPRDRRERSKPPSGGAGPPSAAEPAPARREDAWTQAQLDLAMIWNQQGMRPDEIAAKLGLSTWTVTQMLLRGRGRPKP